MYVYVDGCRPPRGLGRGAPATPWATVAAVAAVGPGGWGHLERLYKAPTDYTKLKKIIQRHRILDKTSKILDNNQTHETRVATSIN